MHPIRFRRLFLLTTAFAAFAHPGIALAQSPDARITSIEQQIRALSNELARVKRELATKDAAVKAAHDEAAAATRQAQQAQEKAQATQTAIAALPPPAAPVVDQGPKLPPGAFRIGGMTVTLGGFAAVEGIYRQRNQAASIDTNLNTGIPLPNSPNYHLPEYRESSQQSRISLLAEGNIDSAQKLTSFLETDFLSAGTSSNSNQSSSYTLRLRQFWGEYDNSDLGLHIEGGQGWSLATMYRHGLLPRAENVPLTIDAQYVVGFDWQRQAELRIVKDFADNRLSAALSFESPQTLFSPSGGPNCLTGAQSATAFGGGTLEYGQCGGSNVNTIQNYSDSVAPDIIAKLAADPGYGHYEVYGLMRFLNGRVSNAASGGGRSYNTTGQGVGGAALLPIIANKLDFQVSGLIGQGVGRYGTAQLPDATFDTTGKIEPISAYSVMGGFVAHPVPSVDIYAYAGAEQALRKPYGTGSGYGNSNVNLAGCFSELGTCNAATSSVVEGTLGAWWRPIKGPYGTIQVGAQYAYVGRDTFSGVGATRGSKLSPSTDENVFLLSFRYYPFQ